MSGHVSGPTLVYDGVMVESHVVNDTVMVRCRILPPARQWWTLPNTATLRRLARDTAERSGRRLRKGVARTEIRGRVTEWLFRYELEAE